MWVPTADWQDRRLRALDRAWIEACRGRWIAPAWRGYFVGVRPYLAALVAVLGLCPAAAQGATTSFGADLDQPPAQGCSTTAGARCAYVTSTPAAGSLSAAAPQTGVVTQVRLRTDGPAATYQVRVLSGSALMVSTLGEVSVHVDAGPRLTTLSLGEGASLPILAGQRLGLAVTVPVGDGDPLFRTAAGGGATCERNGPELFAAFAGLGIDSYSSAGCQGEALVNAMVEFDQDNDGLGDQTQDGDDDSDGVSDNVDNCASVPNPDQSDIDGDDRGDACDADDDGDGFDDRYDNCPAVYNVDTGELEQFSFNGEA